MTIFQGTSHTQLLAYAPKQACKFSMLLGNVVNIFHFFELEQHIWLQTWD